MSTKTSIEWTEHSWNPTTGCNKISPGCQNCYAEIMARRLRAMGVRGYENGFRLTLQPKRLHDPLQRKKPTIYFVNSMSDLFHKKIPDKYIRKVFDVMNQSPQHVFQVLTKRAGRMVHFLKSYNSSKNVWMGVSVENKKHGVPRIDMLRKVNTYIRFLSLEPLIEDIGEIDLSNIDWIIVGGESGPKARPMNPEWVQRIKKQCDQKNILFFFKQWGGWGADGKKRTKKANGRLLFGKTWNNMPAPAQNIFHGMNKTGHFDRKYTIPEERI